MQEKQPDSEGPESFHNQVKKLFENKVKSLSKLRDPVNAMVLEEFDLNCDITPKQASFILWHADKAQDDLEFELPSNLSHATFFSFTVKLCFNDQDPAFFNMNCTKKVQNLNKGGQERPATKFKLDPEKMDALKPAEIGRPNSQAQAALGIIKPPKPKLSDFQPRPDHRVTSPQHEFRPSSKNGTSHQTRNHR